MLVIHMDSGLGNQMLDYAEFLAIQKSNPGKECYLENIIYDLPAKQGMFSMWNGYELERIFGIKVPNIREKFDESSWKRILKNVEESKFWEEGWNYSPYIVEAFGKEGVLLGNLGKKKIEGQEKKGNLPMAFRHQATRFFRTAFGYQMKRLVRKTLTGYLVSRKNKTYDIFRNYPDDSYVGHSFGFKYKGFGIEKMDREIRRAFRFPPFQDEKDLQILERIQAENSVSIHARRSDLLFLNGHCYEHGFFRRSVKYIKKKVKNPVFIFFTDENSVGWCEENEKIFGLDFNRDKVEFVTWNKGMESYRDMQLMAQCKHNIFTESTFGFWGAYLNQNPDKITCAPDCTILATNTF